MQIHLQLSINAFNQTAVKLLASSSYVSSISKKENDFTSSIDVVLYLHQIRPNMSD